MRPLAVNALLLRLVIRLTRLGQGLKNPFLCPGGRVALSCGRVAQGGRTNASCGPFAQWPERYHGCEQWRIHGGGAVGATPPQSEESGLWRVFFGNQFSRFVVIFLFQGLINSSPITNLSPQDFFAIKANQPTDNDTHTCISTLCEADTNIIKSFYTIDIEIFCRMKDYAGCTVLCIVHCNKVNQLKASICCYAWIALCISY